MAPLKSAFDKITQAIQLQRQGQLDAAEKIYRGVLRKQPGNADALHFLGVLQHQLGQGDKAVESISRALIFNPRYLDAHLNLGNIHRELGQLDHAAARYRQVLALAPDHALAHNNLGVVLRNQERFDESVQVLQQGLERNPSHAELLHNLGNTRKNLQQHDQAIDAYRRAIGANAHQYEAYFSLWQVLLETGRPDEASAVLRDWLAVDPDNPIPRHHLLASGGGEVPARASDGYVKRTFDEFASSFDKVLEHLGYQAPAQVARALAEQVPLASRQFDLLDAGCGTGLCGPLLEPWAKALIGVDLSSGMLNKARGRKVYHRLVESELVAHLAGSPAAYQVIVSADTLIYFGELGPLFQAARSALREPGLLIFTVERADADDGPGYVLSPYGRYAHHQRYVERCLGAAGFELLSLDTVALRRESGKPAWGLLVCAAGR